MQKWEEQYCGAFLEYLNYVNTVASHSYVWHDTLSLYSRICNFLKGCVKSTEYRFTIRCYSFLGVTAHRTITAWVDCEGNLMFLEKDEVVPLENFSPLEMIAIVSILKAFFNIEPDVWLPDKAESLIEGINNTDNIMNFKKNYFVMPMVTIQGNLIEIVNWHRFYMR